MKNWNIKELIQIEFDKGEKKAKEETAVNMLKIGVDVKIISQATGLSQKKIKQLGHPSFCPKSS